MTQRHEDYFKKCVEFKEKLESETEILQVAKEILELPNHFLGLYDSLPRSARHIKTGTVHSVAYVGSTIDDRHVVFSVKAAKPYRAGKKINRIALEMRINGFDDLAHKGFVPPLAVVSTQISDSVHIAGLLLEDITQGGKFELQEIEGRSWARVITPDGSYRAYIDPVKISLDHEIGREYFDATHLQL